MLGCFFVTHRAKWVVNTHFKSRMEINYILSSLPPPLPSSFSLHHPFPPVSFFLSTHWTDFGAEPSGTVWICSFLETPVHLPSRDPLTLFIQSFCFVALWSSSSAWFISNCYTLLLWPRCRYRISTDSCSCVVWLSMNENVCPDISSVVQARLILLAVFITTVSNPSIHPSNNLLWWQTDVSFQCFLNLLYLLCFFLFRI